MNTQESPNLDKLIAIEWDTLQGLTKLLNDPKVSTGEKARLANAVAYHTSVLNKMLNQKGEAPRFNEASLGDFIKNVDAKTRVMIRRDFKLWTKRLSSKK